VVARGLGVPAVVGAEALKEVNPMLGFRGVRLLLLRPGIFRMQLKALLEAAKELREEGFDPRPEVMVPLVADPRLDRYTA
jgi:pyruvate,orthophosphate dikinase